MISLNIIKKGPCISKNGATIKIFILLAEKKTPPPRKSIF
jgi:hypothetical protein